VQFAQFWDEERLAAPRILVAEDDEAVRRVIARFLRARGCDVLEVADGTQALAALQHGGFDAVVSDISMPGASGLEVWRAASQWHPELRNRFVFISALAPEAPVASEGVRFLSKPFEMSALWQEVGAVLTGRR
jgi:two-component system cell cycle response regulator CpdR